MFFNFCLELFLIIKEISIAISLNLKLFKIIWWIIIQHFPLSYIALEIFLRNLKLLLVGILIYYCSNLSYLQAKHIITYKLYSIRTASTIILFYGWTLNKKWPAVDGTCNDVVALYNTGDLHERQRTRTFKFARCTLRWKFICTFSDNILWNFVLKVLWQRLNYWVNKSVLNSP